MTVSAPLPEWEVGCRTWCVSRVKKGNFNERKCNRLLLLYQKEGFSTDHMCAITVSAVFFMLCASVASAGEVLQKCSISGPPPVGAAQGRTADGPSCGMEITCTDRPLQLGYSDGICFRATCPGIWALIHKRVDQASFRRRFMTYRHYSFSRTLGTQRPGCHRSRPGCTARTFPGSAG